MYAHIEKDVLSMKTIGERIAEALKMRNMKQIELSAKSGIDRSMICSYIKGRYEPNANNIYRLAKALNVNEGWLLGYDISPERKNKEATPEAEITSLFNALSGEQKQQVLDFIAFLKAKE